VSGEGRDAVDEVLASQARNYPLNCWYVAGTGDEIGPGMITRHLLGQQVLLYRRASGEVVAMEDRCAHRSLPLSRGRLDGDRVTCAYHGFVFGPTGECVRVPSQEHVPPGSRVRVFPVREDPPFVWIWPGDRRRAGLAEPPRLRWLHDPGWATVGGSARVAANYWLLHENALDLTHFPFVHGEASPYGYTRVPPRLEIEVSETSVSYSRTFPAMRLVDWQATATGLSRELDYPQRERGTFVSPALHVDHMDVLAEQGDGAGAYEKVFIRAFTPESPGATRVFWQIARNYALRDGGVGKQLAAIHEQLMAEDIDLLEDIQAHADGRPNQMRVQADLASLRAHQIVETMLAEERGRAALRPGYSHHTAHQ
jgi:phenylpropionate dioxygenase-like ring-hydroxylating dioxygenase large terminal subunit